MDSASLLHVFSVSLLLAFKVSAPVLIAALVVGLAISLFQALTQITDGTLAFLPKLLIMSMVAWFTLPWVVREMVEFTTQVFAMAAEAAR